MRLAMVSKLLLKFDLGAIFEKKIVCRSDPEDGNNGWGMSPRGAGYLFGADVVKVKKKNKIFEEYPLKCKSNRKIQLSKIFLL